MNCNCSDRVIYMSNIVTEPYAKYNQKSGYHTDDDRTCCINDITRCSDCYQTCK